AERGETVAHVDRAAAGMDRGDDELAQAAVAGGAADELAEVGDGRHGGVAVGRLALADDADHLGNEAVEADGDGRRRRGAEGAQLRGEVGLGSGHGGGCQRSDSRRMAAGSSSSTPGKRPMSGSRKRLSWRSSLAVETSPMTHSSEDG